MFSFGFYNSKNGDRKYNAEHFGKIFDGVITDGVFGTLGDKVPGDPYIFKVSPSNPASLNAVLGRGKAWFDHTWNVNDGLMTLTFDQVQVNRKRTDAVCLQVNKSYSVGGLTPRVNSIVIVKGPEISTNLDDDPPSLSDYQIKNSANETIIWQYPLAYVTIYGSNRSIDGVSYSANSIYSIDIKSRIQVEGETDENKYKTWVPLVTGSTVDPTNYIPSLTEFEDAFREALTGEKAYFNSWFEEMKETIVMDPSAEAALAQLNLKIDNKIIYGTEEPTTLEPNQVYFQIEDQ